MCYKIHNIFHMFSAENWSILRLAASFESQLKIRASKYCGSQVKDFIVGWDFFSLLLSIHILSNKFYFRWGDKFRPTVESNKTDSGKW